MPRIHQYEVYPTAVTHYETTVTHHFLFEAAGLFFNIFIVCGMAVQKMSKSIESPALVQHPCAVTAGKALLHYIAHILR